MNDELKARLDQLGPLLGEEGKRWSAIQYLVNGRQFDVNFTFPEELRAGEDSVDRRRAALKKHFGDKPIIYPPVPDHFIELK